MPHVETKEKTTQNDQPLPSRIGQIFLHDIDEPQMHHFINPGTLLDQLNTVLFVLNDLYLNTAGEKASLDHGP